MTKKHRRRPPPWSNKKRVGVAGLAALGIFLVAYVVGGGIHILGQKMGWITKSQSVRNQVIEQVLGDQKMAEAIHDVSVTRSCENNNIGVEFVYQPPTQVVIETGPQACTQLLVSNSFGTKSRIIVTQEHSKLADVTSSLLSGMDAVNAESVYISHAHGTKIRGIREDQQYLAYVLTNKFGKTWTVELFPADDLTQQTLEQLVDNLYLK